MLALARTAVDLGREHGFEDGVVACDAALRMGVSRAGAGRRPAPDDLLAARHPGPRAVRGADGGAQNVGESLLRLMVLELDIGRPETQYGWSRARAGPRWTCGWGGTCSSSTAGSSTSTGCTAGSRTGRSSQVLWEEKQREDWLRRAGGGHGMSRVVWEEMFGARRRETLRRLFARSTSRRWRVRVGRELSAGGRRTTDGESSPSGVDGSRGVPRV